MSISPDELTKEFIVVYPEYPVQIVRNMVGDNIWTYIVVDSGGGEQAIFLLAHLIEKLTAARGTDLSRADFDLPVGEVPGLLDSFRTLSVDVDGEITLAKARKQAISLPLKCMVARRGAEILGLVGLLDTVRSGDVPAVDFSLIPEEVMHAANGGGTLSAGEPKSAPPSEKPIEPRIINSEIMDMDFNKFNPADTPLKSGGEYVLSFFVDSLAADTSFATGEISGTVFGDEDEIVLTVQLESDDFKIADKVQKLAVPRTGKSKKIRYEISPLKDGDGVINAVFLKDGAFVQVMTLRFKVGATAGKLFEQEVQGRAVNDAGRLKPRDVTLTILEGVGGYQIVLSGATAAFASLPLNKAQLHQMVAQARKDLLEVVYFTTSGVRLYQTRIDIPAPVKDQTLVKLANTGWQLFDKLFFGPGHDLQVKQMGEALKQLARDQHLKLQIFSKDFTLPWGLLYVGDDPDKPEPEMFLGLKHIIEHIPLQQGMQVLDQEIDASGGFSISLNVNKDIDTQMGQPIIQRQIDYWQELAGKSGKIVNQVRSDLFDVMEAINGETNDQFLYFYCHAITHDLKEDGGPDQSRIVLTGNQELTLAKMRRAKNALPGKPVIFINACESAELSPEFYDGFVPYFVNKGARGVIGTECETPALFAEEFANRFFRRFLAAEQSLGEIFLEMRREFFFNHHNIMGLLYALYIDGDTALSAPILAGTG